MRLPVAVGLVLALAAPARAAPVPYVVEGSESPAPVVLNGRRFKGFHVAAGGTLVLTATGPGTLEVAFVPDKGGADAKFTAAIDGALQAGKDLALAPGEHRVVLAVPREGRAGAFAFPDAVRRYSSASVDLSDPALTIPVAPKPPSLDIGLDDKPAVAAKETPPLDLGLEPLPPLAEEPPAPAPIAKAPEITPVPAIAAKVEPVEPPAPAPVRAAPKSLEVGAKGGVALARGELAGPRGIGFAELAYRLDSQGFPAVRATAAFGYALVGGAWHGIDPRRGAGPFLQNTQVVPLEIGATFEPLDRAGVSPYLGAAFAIGLAATSFQRFSLPEERTAGAAFGFVACAGVRVPLAPATLVLEARHDETATSTAALDDLPQGTLSKTSLVAGLLLGL